MARDDMRWLRPKIGQADVLVLASPLYFNGLTGEAGITEPMKRLQEQLAIARHFYDRPYEHAVHTTSEPVNLRKVVIVSGCGFQEIDDFYPVLTHLKALCYNTFPELAGCISGPVRSRVRGALRESASKVEIVRVAREAGRNLVKDHAQAGRSLIPSTGGDSALGGDDMDRAIAEALLAKANVSDRSPQTIRYALDMARAAKHALTDEGTTTWALGDFKGELTRAEMQDDLGRAKEVAKQYGY
jgi:multimeric flavodoxin WrbA